MDAIDTAERHEEHEPDGGAPRLRLVRPEGPPEPAQGEEPAYDRTLDEAGTTTAEYTVVTGAAVAFGALLFKLLTSSWGDRILSTAFKQVISLLGF